MDTDPDRDRRLEHESDAAAAEAGRIGGRRPGGEDEAREPVEQAGGGVAEGFEDAEEVLRDRAEHREAGGNPKYDEPEREAAPDPGSHGQADQARTDETAGG